MINILFPPYPDEIFYSWFGRYHLLSGNTCSLHTDFELFHIKRQYRNIFYPTNLNYFCSQLPTSFNVSSDKIINDNTCFPFFKPFLKTSLSNSVVQSMKDRINRPIINMIGLYPSNLFNEKIIKICSQCVSEDILTNGETYIHKIHQIPGCFICPHHLLPLEYIDLPNTGYGNSFFVLNNILNHKVPFKINKNIYEQLLKLQSDIIYLLESNVNDCNIDTVKRKYRQKLYDTGYSTSKRLVNHKKLVIDFLAFYTEDFLKFLNCNIDTDNINDDWLCKITQNSSVNVHPIRHLLFIRFLFGELNNFINQSEEFLPFGSGPWPCLNITSEHYKKDIIPSYKLRKSSHDYKMYGIFECKCGFIYTRARSDQEADDRYKKKAVINCGEVWENKATTLIISENHSIRKLSSILDCSCGKVISHATKNNLLQHLNTKNTYRVINDNFKITNDLLEKHKQSLSRFICEHENMSRSDIFNAIPRECNTVLKNDKEWYDNAMPKKLDFNITRHCADWQKRDLKISKQLLRVINEIKADTDFKLTKTRIANKLGLSYMLKLEYYSRLPITQNIIENSMETKEEYLKRKIKYNINNTFNNGISLTTNQLINKLQLPKMYAESLHDYINEAIKKYHSQ